LVALAEEALRRGLDVAILAGYRSAAKVFPASRVSSEVDYVITTNDGSVGKAGFVTDLARDYLAWADQVCACGPVSMLRALAGLKADWRMPVQIAMEEHMGCAMGVCLGCVVSTRKGYQRVCRDGPVFELDELGWN
jgi:dihydroorotate dehydrogenase electron transfer subunit